MSFWYVSFLCFFSLFRTEFFFSFLVCSIRHVYMSRYTYARSRQTHTYKLRSTCNISPFHTFMLIHQSIFWFCFVLVLFCFFFCCCCCCCSSRLLSSIQCTMFVSTTYMHANSSKLTDQACMYKLHTCVYHHLSIKFDSHRIHGLIEFEKYQSNIFRPHRSIGVLYYENFIYILFHILSFSFSLSLHSVILVLNFRIKIFSKGFFPCFFEFSVSLKF